MPFTRVASLAKLKELLPGLYHNDVWIFSFFLLHFLLPLLCLAEELLVFGVIQRNTGHNKHVLISEYLMVFLTVCVHFTKLKAQFLVSLTSGHPGNVNLRIPKSCWFCVKASFFSEKLCCRYK